MRFCTYRNKHRCIYFVTSNFLYKFIDWKKRCYNFYFRSAVVSAIALILLILLVGKIAPVFDTSMITNVSAINMLLNLCMM